MAADGRPLSPGEVALARSMFGEAIDYAATRIHERRWWPLQPRNWVMAPGGALWLHPDGPLAGIDFAAADLPLQGLFIHEMTHVWQAQTRGRWWLPLMRHPFCRYAYRLASGRRFERYGIEQQAEIVRHTFLLRRGVAVGCAPLADYAALLPFTPPDAAAPRPARRPDWP